MIVERDYLLGTHDEELQRLGLQHAVWRPHALSAWSAAGITTGHTVIDVGCGPGFASLDLAEMVGPAGRVLALDQSARFLGFLHAAAETRGLRQISTHAVDLSKDPWPAALADAAWCRWVAAFLPDPRVMIDHLRLALRPGGVFIAHEYADYRSWRLMPRSAEFEGFVDRVISSWRGSGGEPDAGLSLPGMLEDAGFDVVSTTPIVMAVRPSDFVWQWPRAFVDVGLKRLVSLGQLDAGRATDIWQDFLVREADGRTRMLTPVVLEIIARKRS